MFPLDRGIIRCGGRPAQVRNKCGQQCRDDVHRLHKELALFAKSLQLHVLLFPASPSDLVRCIFGGHRRIPLVKEATFGLLIGAGSQ